MNASLIIRALALLGIITLSSFCTKKKSLTRHIERSKTEEAHSQVRQEQRTLNLTVNNQSVMDKVSSQILQKYDNYDLVAIGERHWGQLDADLRMAIVNNPDFPNKVDDVLIEFGNSLYQSLLDSYVFGDDITYDEVAVVWQNTTQVGVWEPDIYGLMIKSIRELNFKLPKGQKVRVLAGGLPIDWSKITSGKDYAKQIATFHKDRGSYPALIAEKEILNKNRKAIAFFGHGQIDKNSGQVITGN